MTTRVFILILSYNGKELLEECLDTYLESSFPLAQVVVIDNGSTDGTSEWVKQHYKEVKVLRSEENLGYSGGFNFGLKYAFEKKGADYVLVTNNDVRADKHVIRELIKIAQSDDSIGFVTGKVYFYDNPEILQTVGKEFSDIVWNGRHIGGRELDNGQYNTVSERHFIDDIFMLVKKEVYFDVGAYDTTFFLQCEEWDWQARAKQRGYKIYYTPFAKIWHKDSMTIGKWSPQKAYYDSRNPGIVIMKYKDNAFIKKYLKHHFNQFVLKNSIKYILKGKPGLSIAIIHGYLSMIKWGIRNKKISFKLLFR